jgi:hypothetical protein
MRPSMPFSPSDFQWWVWLLFALGADVVCIVSGALFSKDESFEIPCGVLAAAAALTAALSFLIGIIRFVKWAWGG